MNKHTIAVGLISLVLLGLSACTRTVENTTIEPVEPAPSVTVEEDAVTPQTVPPTANENEATNYGTDSPNTLAPSSEAPTAPEMDHSTAPEMDHSTAPGQ